MKMSSAGTMLMVAALVMHAASGQAAMSRSTSYALEYGTFCSAAVDAATLTGDYSLVANMNYQGVDHAPSSSAAYTIESLVGGSSSPATSSAADWTLY